MRRNFFKESRLKTSECSIFRGHVLPFEVVQFLHKVGGAARPYPDALIFLRLRIQYEGAGGADLEEIYSIPVARILGMGNIALVNNFYNRAYKVFLGVFFELPGIKVGGFDAPVPAVGKHYNQRLVLVRSLFQGGIVIVKPGLGVGDRRKCCRQCKKRKNPDPKSEVETREI